MADREEKNAAKPMPPPLSEAERRKARWKALIQEHIEVVERNMAEREDEQERGALAEVVAGLRRREEELDGEPDAEAWAAAHPPKKMPEAKVEYYRRRSVEVMEWEREGRLDNLAPYVSEETLEDLRRFAVESREHAAVFVREYEANGYVEHFEPDDFGFPPNYLNLLYGKHL